MPPDDEVKVFRSSHAHKICMNGPSCIAAMSPYSCRMKRTTCRMLFEGIPRHQNTERVIQSAQLPSRGTQGSPRPLWGLHWTANSRALGGGAPRPRGDRHCCGARGRRRGTWGERGKQWRSSGDMKWGGDIFYRYKIQTQKPGKSFEVVKQGLEILDNNFNSHNQYQPLTTFSIY